MIGTFALLALCGAQDVVKLQRHAFRCPEGDVEGPRRMVRASGRLPAANWKAILERGAALSKASAAQISAFKKHMAASDEAQKGRVDALYERQDYRDTNGDAVNLSIHYKHVYSDGQGNYTLSKRPLNRGGLTELTPVK